MYAFRITLTSQEAIVRAEDAFPLRKPSGMMNRLSEERKEAVAEM